MNLTDDEMALLTDEEREGLEESDTIETDEGDDLDGDDDAGGDDGDGEDDDDDVEVPGEADPAPEVDEPPADTPAIVEPPVVDEDDDDQPVVRPLAADRIDEQAVQAQLAEIAEKRDALADKLDDGELTTKEYTAQIEALADEKNKLTNALARQQERDEAAVTSWYGTVEKFAAQHPELKLNDTRWMSFDTVVRRVTSDQTNAALSDRKQLQKAYEIWRDEMGYVEPVKEGATPAPKPAKAAKPKPELPPTLQNVPAADLSTTDDGKFSHLDALMNKNDVLGYEAALGRLSDAEQEDYLSRA